MFTLLMLKRFLIKTNVFSILKNDSWFWHRSLGHASMSIISTLSKKNLVDGYQVLLLKKIKFVIHINLENSEKLFQIKEIYFNL